MKKVLISLLIIISLFLTGCNSEKIIEVSKKDVQDSNKFDIYLERDNRIIYKSSNLIEIYYKGMSLKEHISRVYQTLDDSLKDLTDLMELDVTFKDGGTKIYRSMEYDLTIVTCNRIKVESESNRDVYIGDYKLEYNNNICNR